QNDAERRDADRRDAGRERGEALSGLVSTLVAGASGVTSARWNQMEIVSYSAGASNAVLDRIRSRGLHANPEVVARVSEIVEGVRSGGDDALLHYTREFDGVRLEPRDLRVDHEFLERTAAGADSRTLDFFRRAIENIRTFHLHQLERSWEIQTARGAIVGQRILPLSAAGLYVPGGRAAYPSTVAMNAIPAL